MSLKHVSVLGRHQLVRISGYRGRLVGENLYYTHNAKVLVKCIFLVSGYATNQELGLRSEVNTFTVAR
jgi:hypothetical protein